MTVKILIPMKESSDSGGVLLFVAELIRMLSPRSTVEIVLLGTISQTDRRIIAGMEAPNVSLNQAELNRLWEQKTEELETASTMLQARGISVNRVVEFGDVVDIIISYANSPEFDLVAMAVPRRFKLSDRVVHRSVLKRLNKPVLFV